MVCAISLGLSLENSAYPEASPVLTRREQLGVRAKLKKEAEERKGGKRDTAEDEDEDAKENEGDGENDEGEDMPEERKPKAKAKAKAKGKAKAKAKGKAKAKAKAKGKAKAKAKAHLIKKPKVFEEPCEDMEEESAEDDEEVEEECPPPKTRKNGKSNETTTAAKTRQAKRKTDDHDDEDNAVSSAKPTNKKLEPSKKPEPSKKAEPTSKKAAPSSKKARKSANPADEDEGLDETLVQEIVDFASRYQDLLFAEVKTKAAEEKLEYEGNFQFSIYWSRPAVGLKGYRDDNVLKDFAYFQFPKDNWNLGLACAISCANILVAWRFTVSIEHANSCAPYIAGICARQQFCALRLRASCLRASWPLMTMEPVAALSKLPCSRSMALLL